MAIIYGLKVNLSVAMVAMVNHTALRLAQEGAKDDHGGSIASNNSNSEVCLAENSTSSSDNQVNIYTKTESHRHVNENQSQ